MTRHLGTLKGADLLKTEAGPIGTVRYEIQVIQEDNDGFKQAFGFIEGDWQFFRIAFEAGGATLELPGEKSVKILVSHFNPGTGTADITVSGPVPGY